MTALNDNIAKLSGFLTRFQDTGIQNRIAGLDRPGSAGTFQSISPVDKSVICEVAHGTDVDIDAAARGRQGRLSRLARHARSRAQEDPASASPKVSKPAPRKSRCANAGTPARPCGSCQRRPCAGRKTSAILPTGGCSARDGQHLPSPTLMNITTRVPIGPVGVITPWNTPFMLSTWKIAPALAAGCTVVHKPAEFSPLTARLLVEIAEEAGLPPGVLEPGQRLRRRRGQGADRTSRHQGHRLCRRKPHRRR